MRNDSVDDKDVKRLGDLLGRLASAHAGERAAAALLATRHLEALPVKVTWAEVAQRAFRPTPPPLALPPPVRHPTLGAKAQIRFALACSPLLDEWERGFVRSLDAQTYPLTPRQREKLAEVHERVSRRCGAAGEAAP